ncbi:MAG: two-component regulator propeller domain-containing protein [Lutibacter sp.]
MSFTQIWCQTPSLTNFTTKNGLPSNTIYDVTTDNYGFLWIATDYGVSKFDGKTFTNYTIKDGLPGNEILFFFKDSQNRIWLSSFNGKIGFIKNEIFHNSKTDSFLKKLKFNRFVKDIFEDSSGTIYFTQNYKILKSLSQNTLDLGHLY